jgi:flagellar biosynthesis GTPase FlhF
VYVIGNIFLYYEEGNPNARRSPDLMVVKGVEAQRDRRSFFTWEERAVPSVVMEFTSRQTADEDLGPKKELYEALGVREYFLFDPLNEYLPRPLIGYRLIGGKYEELVPAIDGGVLSAELGMRLVPQGEELALFLFRTGQRILPPPLALEQEQRRVEELLRHAEQERRRVEEAEKQAVEARRQTEAERQRTQEAEQQATEARRQAEAERRRVEEAERQAAEARRQADEERTRAEQDQRRTQEAEQQAAEARRQAEEANRQAEEERQRAAQAQQQLAALAEELARLKAQLQPPDTRPPE